MRISKEERQELIDQDDGYLSTEVFLSKYRYHEDPDCGDDVGDLPVARLDAQERFRAPCDDCILSDSPADQGDEDQLEEVDVQEPSPDDTPGADSPSSVRTYTRSCLRCMEPTDQYRRSNSWVCGECGRSQRLMKV